jgi:hypothetical protein
MGYKTWLILRFVTFHNRGMLIVITYLLPLLLKQLFSKTLSNENLITLWVSLVQDFSYLLRDTLHAKGFLYEAVAAS